MNWSLLTFHFQLKQDWEWRPAWRSSQTSARRSLLSSCYAASQHTNTRSFIFSHNKSSLRLSLSRFSRNSLVRRSISYVQICCRQTGQYMWTVRTDIRCAGLVVLHDQPYLSCNKFQQNRKIYKENWTEIHFRPWIKYDVTKPIFMKTLYQQRL
jgi:hypothetical protein